MNDLSFANVISNCSKEPNYRIYKENVVSGMYLSYSAKRCHNGQKISNFLDRPVHGVLSGLEDQEEQGSTWIKFRHNKREAYEARVPT